MKPITEDQVLSLMKGLESREKNALKCLKHPVERQDTGGRMTARILSYTRAETENRAAHDDDAKPVALDDVRAAQKARRTTQGQFFYSDGAGQSPA